MMEKFEAAPVSINLVLVRFICAIFLHISFADELNQGMVLMKYALNHYWKFDSWLGAYCVGMT